MAFEIRPSNHSSAERERMGIVPALCFGAKNKLPVVILPCYATNRARHEHGLTLRYEFLFKPCYSIGLAPPRSEVCVFLSVKELELKKVRFEVPFPPGEIDYGEGLRQATPLEVRGSAELLAHTLGEVRIQGHLKVRMRSDCDRCLEPAEFPIESDFDLFYR